MNIRSRQLSTATVTRVASHPMSLYHEGKKYESNDLGPTWLPVF
jgi:hypothetical protein